MKLAGGLCLLFVGFWILVWVFAFGPKWLGTVGGSAAARRVVDMQFAWLAAAYYLFHSKDKAFSLKDVKDAVHTDLKDPKLVTKTIVFIRHGNRVGTRCLTAVLAQGSSSVWRGACCWSCTG